MTFCSELLVLLPCHDLDDLAGRARDGTGSVLTAWTAAWHPGLLEQFRKLPLWYNADAPPEPDPHRAGFIPTASESLVPTSWTMRLESEAAREQSDVLAVTERSDRHAWPAACWAAPPEATVGQKRSTRSAKTSCKSRR